MFNNWEIAETITIEQKVWFQGGICSLKFYVNKILYGRLVIIVDFNMRNIWKTIPDS